MPTTFAAPLNGPAISNIASRIEFTRYNWRTMMDSAPKVFVSYSWSSEEHKSWVLKLATDLRDQGVDVCLDRWDLKEGMDKFHFMESMITNPEMRKIVIVCDKVYTEKSNSRIGGVGTESEIISSELYTMVDQTKFAAVVREYSDDGAAYIPTMLKSRIYFDFSVTEEYYKKIEEILRWIFDEPVLVKPPIGKKPVFSKTSATPNSTHTFRLAIDSIKSGKRTLQSDVRVFLESFLVDALGLRIGLSKVSEYDEFRLSLDKCSTIRDEFVEILDSIVDIDDKPGFSEIEKVFFDLSLTMSTNRISHEPELGPSNDNFDYFVHELFLHSLSRLIKKEKYDFIDSFLAQRYTSNAGRGKKSTNFSVFHSSPRLIRAWNESKQNGKLYFPVGDLIFDRSKSSRAQFSDIAFADLVLYFRDAFDALRNDERQKWFSQTLLYASIENIQFPLAIRAESSRLFQPVMSIFGASQITDFDPVRQAIKDRRLYLPVADFREIDVFELANISNWGKA